MRDGSLRYGLSSGLGAAIVGVLSLMIGAVIAPISTRPTSADAVVVAVSIRGLIAYLGLFVGLALAYYAGGQTERQRVAAGTQEPADQATKQVSRDPFRSALAGAIVMLCYWFVTTVYAYVVPAAPAPKSDAGSGLQTAEAHAIYGIILVLLGAGMASLGGRTAFTRRVLSGMVITAKPASLPAPPPSANGAAPPAPALESSEATSPPSAPSD